MFFQSLNEMLRDGDTLVVFVNKTGAGTLSVTMTPKGEFKNASLGAGLNVEASPAELDDELHISLGRYSTARKSLQEQVEAAATVLDSATKAVTDETVKKLNSTSKQAPKEQVVAGGSKGGSEAPQPTGDEGVSGGSVSLF